MNPTSVWHLRSRAAIVAHELNLTLMFCSVFYPAKNGRAIVTFWEHFLRLLPHKPKQALAALYWHLTRRRVRARNRLRAASTDLPFAYDVWVDRVERNSSLRLEDDSQNWHWRPKFSVVLYADGQFTRGQLERSVRSVEQQTYPSWTLAQEPVSAIATALQRVESDYVILLRVGDALSKPALFRTAEALQTRRSAMILYGDQDELDCSGRRTRPWFKPRWNEELFLAVDLLSGVTVIDADLARSVAEIGPQHGLSQFLLAATTAANGAVTHIPHILCHVAASTSGHQASDRLHAVAGHVKSRGARCVPGPFGTLKVEWPLPVDQPLVSIIVPTKDKLNLLHPCIQSVLERTDYRNFEVVIVDNGSVEQRTAEFLATIHQHPRVRVISFSGRYNFSAINNFAVRHTTGTYVCLLNNDTEILVGTWLSELMRYAVRPDVGAAGAKLLYDDGTIQHAGVVIGIGEAAGHAHRFLPADRSGYFCMPHAAQFVSAVTAACLLVEKKKFTDVGGLDEDLAVAFNDVDLCLRLQAAGWRNVYVPHAVLLHHESKSRGNDMSPQHIDRYMRELEILQTRWNTKTYDDPLHNPNLDRYSETFAIRI